MIGLRSEVDPPIVMPGLTPEGLPPEEKDKEGGRAEQEGGGREEEDEGGREETEPQFETTPGIDR